MMANPREISLPRALSARRVIRRRWGRLGWWLPLALLAIGDPARSEVERIVVRQSSNLGTVGARRYLWITGRMEGVVQRDSGETGKYRVPVVLIYPDRDPNGIGLVDVVNSATFENFAEGAGSMGARTIMYVGDGLFRDQLQDGGYLYMSVEWSRMVTEALGPGYGVIERGADGYEILRDAARFLRKPGPLDGAVPYSPPPVKRAIAFGQGQAGMLLRQFILGGLHRSPHMAPLYDGFLLGATGSLCRTLSDEARPPPMSIAPAVAFGTYVPCGVPLPDGVKIVAIQTESELSAPFSAHLARPHGPDGRQYELAGVARLATDAFDLRNAGAVRQNPISFRPVYRSALDNLARWITEGTAPPESLFLQGRPLADGEFRLETDADGNALGGLRLPHMPSLASDGRPAGAPLGVYRGLDRDHARAPNPMLWLAGAFEPFSAAQTAARYREHRDYVERVTRSADALLAGRYILQDARDAYVAVATKAAPFWPFWAGQGDTTAGGDGAAPNPFAPRAAALHGERLFAEHCALCHGESGRGEDPAQPMGGAKPNGELLAPALDGSGHAWHHPPEDLLSVILNGSPRPRTRMVGWRERLSEAEVRAILVYLYLLWPEFTQRRYVLLNLR